MPREHAKMCKKRRLSFCFPLAGFWILPLCLERHLGQGQRKETPHEGDELVLGCGTNTRGQTRCLEACDGVRGPMGGHARSCPRRLGVRFAEHKHQCPHPWGTGNPGSRQYWALPRSVAAWKSPVSLNFHSSLHRWFVGPFILEQKWSVISSKRR